MNVLMSAGEVSGDIIGAGIAAELRRRDPAVAIWGLGGRRMESEGVDVRAATNQLGCVGVSESVSAIWPFVRAFADVRREVRRSRPDVAILIANDVFNAILGRWLRSQGVRTVAVFPPQIWIWRSLRKLFCQSYDAVAASFPDEMLFYPDCVPTTFVGHYLADRLQRPSNADRGRDRAALGLGEGTVVGLLPGSRTHEVALLAPLLLDVAIRLANERPGMRFVMPYAESAQEKVLSGEIERRGLEATVMLVSDSHAAMRASDLLLLASGTATLEAALVGTPMIALYRVSWFTITIVRLAIRLGLMSCETIALPNLLLGRLVVPEISQENLGAEAVAREASSLLGDPGRMRLMREELDEVRACVEGNGSIERIADLIGSLVRHPAPVIGDRVPMTLEGGSAWR